MGVFDDLIAAAAAATITDAADDIPGPDYEEDDPGDTAPRKDRPAPGDHLASLLRAGADADGPYSFDITRKDT